VPKLTHELEEIKSHLISVHPKEKSKKIPLDTVFTFKFDQEISKVNSSTLVKCYANATPIQGVGIFKDGVLTFSPKGLLPPSSLIHITLDGSQLSNQLSQSLKVIFKILTSSHVTLVFLRNISILKLFLLSWTVIQNI
jgi:hypothetical protein